MHLRPCQHVPHTVILQQLKCLFSWGDGQRSRRNCHAIKLLCPPGIGTKMLMSSNHSTENFPIVYAFLYVDRMRYWNEKNSKWIEFEMKWIQNEKNSNWIEFETKWIQIKWIWNEMNTKWNELEMKWTRNNMKLIQTINPIRY